MTANPIEKGLFLEDTNEWLTWGTRLFKLLHRNKAHVEYLGDRTIINWGHHTILNGLEVNLTTTYLKPRILLLFTHFKEIEHWARGDKAAMQYFETISEHLRSTLGEPTEWTGVPGQDQEISWVWRLGNTKLKLYLFEQHAYKLVFSISSKA